MLFTLPGTTALGNASVLVPEKTASDIIHLLIYFDLPFVDGKKFVLDRLDCYRRN